MSKLRKYHTSKKARDDAIVFPPKYTSLAETTENQPAFEVNEMVERLPKARPGDWLFEREESGQTVSAYQRQIKPGGQYLTPHVAMNKILLVPIGKSFSSSIGQMFLPLLTRLCSDFFTGFDVETHPTCVSLKGVTRRENEHGNPQYKIGEIFSKINTETSRDHKVYCRLGITLEDIYPNDDYNFVYGQARMIERCGVFSFSRHSPLFDDGSPSTATPPPATLSKFFRRCVKTMTHEITHMLGIRHCIYYQCLMNGNNGGGERAAKSSFYCPVCLRKVATMLSLAQGSPVNLMERYFNMKNGWESVISTFETESLGIRNDIRWLALKIQFMGGGGAMCIECDDLPKFVGSDSEEEGIETGVEGKEVEDPLLIRSSEELLNLLASISDHSKLSFQPKTPLAESSSSTLAFNIMKYAIPRSPPTLRASYNSLKLATPSHPNVSSFLFNDQTVSQGSHFDWWMFPTRHVGKSLFSSASANVFLVTDSSSFSELIDQDIYLLSGSVKVAVVNYVILISACVRSVPHLGGVRNTKVQSFLNNCGKYTKHKHVIEDTLETQSKLPMARLEDWMSI